jgi:regulator of sigma E protease
VTLLTTILAFAVTLGILIVIHELGHFTVARLFGVRILRFSIGFGKPLLRWKGRGEEATEWTLSALPLGGYVRMLDERDPDCQPIADADRTKTFNSKPAWQRLLIVLAGPVSNLVLAALIYAGCFYAGVEEPAAVLATPAAETPAYAAGIEKGDRILAVAGRKVETISDLRLALIEKFGEVVPLDAVSASGADKALRLDLRGLSLDEDKKGEDAVSKAGVQLDLGYPVIRTVFDGSSAEKAGLRGGERILAADGAAVNTPGELVAAIQKKAGVPMTLKVQGADGRTFDLEVTPAVAQTEDGRTIGRLGAGLGADISMVKLRYGFFESLWKGCEKTWDTAAFSVRMVGRMITGEVSVKNISGPVTIADYAGQTARIGFEAFVSFLALVSISLGVLNLLPIPMLDGGHVLYYSVELVRGKPVSENFQQAASKVGVLLLVCLTCVALFNDVTRLFT